MLSEHLLIPNWHLPFGMLITRFLKQLKFDLSIEPYVDINSTLLKRMCAKERAPTPQAPSIIHVVAPGSSSASSASFDPYTALSAQLHKHDLKMSANFQRIEHRVQNDLQYICSSIRISRHASTRPIVGTLGLFHFREATRSPFLHLVLCLTPGYLLQLLPRHQLLLMI